ncbi:MAG: hypothetical protein ACE149_04895 [Armatimonadota bacterium]
MEWFREVQFVAAVPMPVEWAREYGTTINGMWDDPDRWDRAKIAEAHAEGRRVLVSVPLIALTARRYEREDESYLLEEACRDINGEQAEVKWYYWDQKPVYAICLYSRVFRDHLLARIKAAIAAGADVVNVDEIQTSIGLISRRPKDPGFCPKCLEKFCAHLEEDSSAREAASVGDVAELRADGYRALLQRLREDDAFYKRYVAFQNVTAFATTAQFLKEIRDAIAEAKSEMALTANLTGIGTFLESNGQLWGASWGELLDFVMMENIYLARVGQFHDVPGHQLLPRGKFVAWYRLASALGGKAPAWITPQIYVPKQLAGKKALNYYLLMFLESYANNGRWGYYWWPGVSPEERREATAPEAIKDYTKFIVANRQYYEGCETRSGLAVLYADSAMLANPQGHFRHLALAQALAEGGYQYDVVYDGDDGFAPAKLNAKQLGRYKAVLLPEAGTLTKGQRKALTAYAKGGGKVIAYTANELAAGPEIESIADDRLLDFWKQYTDAARERVLAPLDALDDLRVRASDPNVGVVTYWKGKTLICQVLDYDYREQDDTIVAKRDVGISLPWSGATPDHVEWLALDGKQELPCTLEDGRLAFTIPSLDPYGLAVVGGV